MGSKKVAVEKNESTKGIRELNVIYMEWHGIAVNNLLSIG